VGKVPALNFHLPQYSQRTRVATRLLVVAICAALTALAAATTREPGVVNAQRRPAPKFHVIALAEPNSIHRPFVDAAKGWLGRESMTENFAIDYIANTEPIDDAFLAQYQLFIQLDYPPYGWTQKAQDAFIKYIEEGKGGWIGFHHAALLGEFDGYPMWDWFSKFMGGIRYKDYIATFVTATVKVEDPKHPVMKGLPATFEIEREEWYTWNKSPRPNVHVLATVDESTYEPDSELKMGGDHPVVWSNENVKARNVYIFMGHRPEHFKNPAFTDLFHNAILWAAGH
jgi:type 1 glutamine amidotransferase